MAELHSESYHVRVATQLALERQGNRGVDVLKRALEAGRIGVLGRLHAVWVLAHQPQKDQALNDLFHLAETDSDWRVRAQAIRALADLSDPVLRQHRLNADRSDAKICRRLAALAENADPRVMLEVVVALGRLHWKAAPDWLRAHLKQPDNALAHAAMQTLRRAQNPQALLKWFDLPEDDPRRRLALRAAANQRDPVLVEGLLSRLEVETDSIRRREYAFVLARVYKKPGPWSYWGYRPPPRPANTLAWEKTRDIERALDRVLADSDRTLRVAVLRRMLREQVPVQFSTLHLWFNDERNPHHFAAISRCTPTAVGEESDVVVGIDSTRRGTHR